MRVGLPVRTKSALPRRGAVHACPEEFGWGVNFVSWSRWESTGDTGRHRETQTAGVGKGWSSRESPGAQHQESLGVVEVVVVYSPTNYLLPAVARRFLRFRVVGRSGRAPLRGWTSLNNGLRTTRQR